MVRVLRKNEPAELAPGRCLRSAARRARRLVTGGGAVRVAAGVVRERGDLRGDQAEPGDAGKVTPVIDRSFPFARIPEAYQEAGHAAAGKVVITVGG
nr:zinc-binding dehydrogenase [Nonomuraea longispora]